MPQKPRLAVFGDSHYACVKRAVDQGLVDASTVELEFWGHAGRRFHHLSFVDGVITPTDDYTAERFAKFSTRNRRSLTVSEFDWVFFMGCRIPAFGLHAAIMQERRNGTHLTDGLTRRIIEDKLKSAPAFGFAIAAARLGTARIVVAPTPFPTGIEPFHLAERFPDIRDTTAAERAELQAITADVLGDAGLSLIWPPDDMFSDGLYNDPDYRVETHAETGDIAHKNAQYGARIFSLALEVVAGKTPATTLQRR
ncbi:MAG: hypothetical protein WBB85_14430 [Albidovulum sp.]|uniref:hypothetical protein n=1 Tax=Albidovulum sp. TaxID=1872424 RepID=UPI003C9C5A53